MPFYCFRSFVSTNIFIDPMLIFLLFTLLSFRSFVRSFSSLFLTVLLPMISQCHWFWAIWTKLKLVISGNFCTLKVQHKSHSITSEDTPTLAVFSQLSSDILYIFIHFTSFSTLPASLLLEFCCFSLLILFYPVQKWLLFGKFLFEFVFFRSPEKQYCLRCDVYYVYPFVQVKAH